MFNFIYFIKINLIFIFISISYSQNSDLMKMRSEYEKMKNNQTGISESVINNNEDIDFGSPKVATISPYLLELARLDSLNKEQVYFGYDFKLYVTTMCKFLISNAKSKFLENIFGRNREIQMPLKNTPLIKMLQNAIFPQK